MADVAEAQDILEALGMPTPQQNRMAGMTLIALCGLSPVSEWPAAKRRRCTVTKGIMEYLANHYGAEYAGDLSPPSTAPVCPGWCGRVQPI